MQLTRKQIHEQVYFYLLLFIAISLPLSIYTTSMFMIQLALNWILEGRFREKWKKIKENRALQVFLLLFGLHVFGLLWSSDIAYGVKDLKIKLPLLSMPIVIASSVSLTHKQLRWILLFFTLAVFAATVASLFKLYGWLPGEVKSFRDLSLYMSHIRYAMMIVLALLISGYFIFVRPTSISLSERIFYTLALLWLPVCLVLLKSLSGLFIAGVLVFIFLLRLVFKISNQVIRYIVLVPVLMIPLLSTLYLSKAYNKFYAADPTQLEELDSLTVEGNPYLHKPENKELENGNFIWIHICDKELEREWNLVSKLEYRGRTTNGNSLRTTLIRFLASKGLRKDANGFKQLSESEVRAIEAGMSNHIFMTRFKLYPRIYEVIWEIDRYRLGGDPNEKSVVQRYLYLDAGWKIARDNLWLGVGNGDVKKSFKQYYDEVNSPLDDQWRRRAHNQFLTFLISFGIPGLLCCLLSLLAPLFLAGRQHSFLAMGFLILVLVSMLSEDTLETAVAAAFVAYFYSLFVFGPDHPWLGSVANTDHG
jgi:hypothetical protein